MGQKFAAAVPGAGPRGFDAAAVTATWRDMADGREPSQGVVRDMIFESWLRCRSVGLDALNHRAPFVDDSTRFEPLRRAHQELLDAAHHTWVGFAGILPEVDTLLLVADPQGIVLDVWGNRELVDSAAREHVAPGYDWSEHAAGTNAFGCAIATGRPTLVRTSEHYCSAAKIWDCAAAPVHDLQDGSVVGLLSITSTGGLIDNHTLALAVTAAKQTGHTLHSKALTKSVQLLNWYRLSDPQWATQAALLLDAKGRVITSSDRASALLDSVPDRIHVNDGRPSLPHDLGLEIAEQIPYRDAQDSARRRKSGDWQGGVIVLDESRSAKTGKTRRQQSAEPAIAPPFARIATADPGFRETIRQAERMARASSPVLVTGETGTGKELFAHAIHACSRVAAGRFIAINCGALSKELAASELLGYEPGAFTGASMKGRHGKFEEADGGTLFLDEIGELPLDVQVHLLRVLQDNVVVRVGGHKEHKVNVRIIAATNRDLRSDSENGKFRPDLYFRLKVLALELPPLRDRIEDIDLLAGQFLRQMQGQYGLGAKLISPELSAALKRYSWPGNVRELHGVIETMYILSNTPMLGIADLPTEFLVAPDSARSPQQQSSLADTSARAERERIIREMARQGNNMSLVARRLDISRSTLYRKLRIYGIGAERQ